MPPIPFALSVHSLLNSAGADAAFAAILGLAILVLLFFAQARETASLRSALEDAATQIESLEARLQAVARAQASVLAPARPPLPSRPLGSAAASVRPATRVGGAASAAPPTMALGGPMPQLPPFAPAGVGAPSLSAATRLIPAPARAPGFVPASAAAIAGLRAGFTADGLEAAEVDATAIAAPLSVAAGNGAGAPRSSLAAPINPSLTGATLAAPGGAVAAGAYEQPRSGSPPRVSLRQPRRGAPKRTGATLSEPRHAPSRPLGARLAPWLIGLAALIVGVAAVFVATGGGSGTTASTPSRTASTARKTTTAGSHHAKSVPFAPATVTVSVLNGTDVAQLAANTGKRLASIGYKQGVIHDAPNQTHASTIVAYLPGRESDALQVAQALHLKTAAVSPVDSGTLAVACPPPGRCTADVVVTIGQDLAAAPSTTTSTSP